MITTTFYYIVWKRDTGETVGAGKVLCNFNDPKGVTNKALQECKKAARIYVSDTGEQVGYCIGGNKTDIANRAKDFMSRVDNILGDMIKKPVSDLVRQLTAEGIERYCLCLYDAFKYAASIAADKRTKLYKAWYKDDFREFIPSAYLLEYLDFNKYPLAY